MKLHSAAIEDASYLHKSHQLLITFRGGRRYKYLKVPYPVYLALVEAPSAGTYFNSTIKPEYEGVSV